MTSNGSNEERPGDDLRGYLDLVDQTVDAISDEDVEADLAAVLARAGQAPARRRPDVRQKRLRYALAAAVVVFVLFSVGALFAGGHWLAPDARTPGPEASSRLDPLTGSEDGPGIGGPEIPGQRYGGTDPRTGVRLDYALDGKEWGTHITFAVSAVEGPGHFRLVAVHTDGTTEVLSSWAVGSEGYGTAGHPEPLLLEATTDMPRDEIAHLEVEEVTVTGTEQTLVRVP